MEAGEETLFMMGIDAEARNDALDIVRNAADPAELLEAVRTHFDERVLTFDAMRVLAELHDNRLDNRLKIAAFDPTLFKAVALFELSHLADESDFPTHLGNLIDFWQGDDRTDEAAAELEVSLVAETRRSVYRPFAGLSRMVLLGIMHATAVAASERLKAEQPDAPPQDPIQEEIDGKQFKVYVGDQELITQEHPVLTRQLVRDMRAFTPGPVIDELLHRFPEQGAFEDVHPLVERIKMERLQGVLPPVDELMACFVRQGGDATWFGRDEHDSYTAADVSAHFVEHFRDPESRMFMHEVYVRQQGAWYTVAFLESDLQCGTFHRRIFYGDETTEEPIEVPPDAREAILAELGRGQHEDELEFGKSRYTIYDVFGSFGV